MAGSGQVGSGQVDGNSDNKATSAQFQLKLPTGAELGKKKEFLENLKVESIHSELKCKYCDEIASREEDLRKHMLMAKVSCKILNC